MAWNQIANKKNNLIFKAIIYVGPSHRCAGPSQCVLTWNVKLRVIPDEASATVVECTVIRVGASD